MLITLFVLVAAVLVAYIVPPLVPERFKYQVKLPDPELPPESIIRLSGGPNDGEVQKIPFDKEDVPNFFIVPYMPTDEDGTPIPDEENIVQHGNMVYVKPNLAYYQQITDEDFFYVRDIGHKEFDRIRVTGELPSVEVKDDD